MAAKKQIVNMPDEYSDRFAMKIADYSKNYRVEDLNDSNDKTLLHMMIRTELMLEGLQTKVSEIMENDDDIIEKANELKKLSDLIRDATENVTKIQRTLAIDRKTRKAEETDSVAEYLRWLKRAGHDFLEQRLVRIYCPDCKVMVARYSAVHDHTAYTVATQCSQCNRWIRANRKERDVWFDVKDADWRKKYPANIAGPSIKSGFSSEDFTAGMEDELILSPIKEEADESNS